ncbi:MAG TPA: IS3 family transposase, partial [Acidimicrobiales bacterium]|nr:IS3 family transposase [Acidimicrobiales bacterium]
KLLTPERRRRAVVVLTQRFGVSERRACGVTGQHRSTQRLLARPRPAEEDKLRRRLRAIARAHPRWGWKTAHSILRREGWAINRKRTQRLWREEGLRRSAPCRRKGTHPPGGGELLRAHRPNQVWALDFQFDETADRRRLKLLNIVDEHTREALAIRVGRSCDADTVVSVIERLVAERGTPERCAWTMGQSFWPGRCGTGVAWPARPRPTSSPARRGRTPSSRASTAGCATSC